MPGRLPLLDPAAAKEMDRLAEEEFHIPLALTMEGAGRAFAAHVRAVAPKGARIVAMVGKGGNGGGALSAARHLANAGYAVTLALAVPTETLLPAAWLQLQMLKAVHAEVCEGRDAVACIARADVVLDGLLGYNARGEPRPPMDALIAAANAARARRLSLDIPTGLDPSAGAPTMKEPFKAESTVMVGFPKVGTVTPEARPWSGRLLLADTGFPRALYAKIGAERPGFDAAGLVDYRD